jgi:hypothetical protein
MQGILDRAQQWARKSQIAQEINAINNAGSADFDEGNDSAKLAGTSGCMSKCPIEPILTGEPYSAAK